MANEERKNGFAALNSMVSDVAAAPEPSAPPNPPAAPTAPPAAEPPGSPPDRRGQAPDLAAPASGGPSGGS